MKFRSSYIELDSIPIEEFIGALAYWNELRGERIAPAWSDVSLMRLDFRVIPFTNVVDIDPDTMESHFRFWGTGLSQIFNGDFTSKTPADIPVAGIRNNGIYGYEKLIREKIPNCEVRDFILHSGRSARQAVLRLPLSDDGISINHSINIHFHEVKGSNEPVSRFFEKVLGEQEQ